MRTNNPVPALLINMDRSADRLKWFSDQAEAVGLRFDRIAAIDGERLAIETLPASWGLTATLGAEQAAILGCWLSHRKAWQRAADSGAPWTAIFEDDVHLSPELASFLADIEWVPVDADAVKLETYCNSASVSVLSTPARDGRRLHRLSGFPAGAAGYLISGRTAAALLAESELPRHADVVLFDTRCLPASGLRLYQLVPALCVQERRLAAWQDRPSADVSTIPHGPSKPLSRNARMGREIARLGMQLAALTRLQNPRMRVPFK